MFTVNSTSTDWPFGWLIDWSVVCFYPRHTKVVFRSCNKNICVFSVFQTLSRMQQFYKLDTKVSYLIVPQPIRSRNIYSSFIKESSSLVTVRESLSHQPLGLLPWYQSKKNQIGHQPIYPNLPNSDPNHITLRTCYTQCIMSFVGLWLLITANLT